MESSLILKYDYKKAYEQGIKGSVVNDLIRLGISIKKFDPLIDLGCALIEPHKQPDKLPNYITYLDNIWEFDYYYPIE